MATRTGLRTDNGFLLSAASVAVLLSGTSLVACSRSLASTGNSANAPVVRVATVGRAAAVGGTRYSARIEAATRVDLAFKVGGYVGEIAKRPGLAGGVRILQEGDAVSSGTELAALRTIDYEQKLAEAQAALAQAKAAAEQAKLDATRAAQLDAAGTISTADSDAARIKLAGASSAREAAQVRVDEAQAALGDTVLRSPMRGILLNRTLEVGGFVAPGSVAFSVADVSTVRAVFGVPDTRLSGIHLGQTQRLTSEAYADAEFIGSVSRIAPAADTRSRVFDVELTIPNQDNRLKPGMVAALVLMSDRASTAPAEQAVIPVAAVVRGKAGGSFAVFTVDEAHGSTLARAKVIELGEYRGRTIAVSEGLDGGERIIVEGAGLVSDGETVQVIP